ncbi:hypothetical protein M378DRAFT_167611, partial [Amanita muscaria Koide BX008]
MNSYPPPNTSTTSSFSRGRNLKTLWSVFASPNTVPLQRNTISLPNVVGNHRLPPENP